jgi:hypothetical protein
VNDCRFAARKIIIKTFQVAVRITLGGGLADDLPDAWHKAMLARTKLKPDVVRDFTAGTGKQDAQRTLSVIIENALMGAMFTVPAIV